ncbi:MAG: FAD-dependent oxidoreductase [Firmicutes bacterium]|nr:FAD-dependent oxidoreductase [Bacillota bacterium]
MTKKRVLIVGGNAAGLSAASQVKRQKAEWEAVVFEKGEYISYAGCGMPYHIEGIVPHLEDLIEITPEAAVTERKIDLRLNCTVIRVDPDKKEILVKDSAGTRAEKFDFLLIATGASPITDHITFEKSKRIFTLKSLSDTTKILQFIEEEKPKKCAVIGGGYIAVEMLEAFQGRGLETHLIHRRYDLARTFEKEISTLIKNKMEQEGIILHLNSQVTALEEKKKKIIVRTNHEDMEYDFVLIATGVKPETELLKDTPIQLGVKNAVKVNRYLQTNYDYIYAAGDCAETVNLITGKPAYVPLAPKANKEGFIAGINICGGKEEFPGVLETSITKFFDLGIARTGLTLDTAEEHYPGAAKFTFSSRSKARYYPGGGTLHSVIILDKASGKILGAQLAGPLDGVKRIDVFAAAIHNKMSVNDIFKLDLSYSPPFSPVFDPVILAARLGRKYL